MSSSAETIIVTAAARRPSDGGCGCGGSTSSGCSCGSIATAESLIGLERPRYFPRQIVGPDDLNQGHRYVNDRLRRHNRFLHGWGIACGLVVTPCGPNEDGTPSCRAKVSAGYALDPYGDEIFVPDPVIVDLCHTDGTGGLICEPTGDPWCAPMPLPPRDGPRFLAIRHVETSVKPVRAPTGCSCSETNCEHSRIRDWFEFTLLDELPEHDEWPCGSLDRYCESVGTCPPCPESGWIVLAAVYEGDSGIQISHGSYRRYVLSLSGFCERCDEQPGLSHAGPSFSGRREMMYLATVSNDPDTTANLDFYLDGRSARLSIAVESAQLRGITGSDLKQLLADVVVLDTETGRPVTFEDGTKLTAATILANSPLRPDSVIDGADDLATRFGRPAIDLVAYRAAISELDSLLDDRGRAEFDSRTLGNLEALGELDIEALRNVSTANAAKLRAVGIETLADLRTATRLPSDLTSAAAEKAERFRGLDLGRRR